MRLNLTNVRPKALFFCLLTLSALALQFVVTTDAGAKAPTVLADAASQKYELMSKIDKLQHDIDRDESLISDIERMNLGEKIARKAEKLRLIENVKTMKQQKFSLEAQLRQLS